MTSSDDVSLRESDIGDMGPGHQTGTLHPDTLQPDTAQHKLFIHGTFSQNLQPIVNEYKYSEFIWVTVSLDLGCGARVIMGRY